MEGHCLVFSNYLNLVSIHILVHWYLYGISSIVENSTRQQSMTGKVKTSKFCPREILRKGALNSRPCWEWSKHHPWLF